MLTMSPSPDFPRPAATAGQASSGTRRLVVEHLCDTENPLLNRSERERLIEEVLDETLTYFPA